MPASRNSLPALRLAALIVALGGVFFAPALRAEDSGQGVGQNAGQDAGVADAGAYLAAKAASGADDFAKAEVYFERLVKAAPEDASAQEGLLVSRLALGKTETALPLAEQMVKASKPSQVAVLTMLAERARKGDFAKDTTAFAVEGASGALVNGIYSGWALLGAGKMSEAAQAFDTVAQVDGLQGFAGYHSALALALVGDYEGAEKIFSGKYAEVYDSTRRGLQAHVEVLSQLERNADALALIDRIIGSELDPRFEALRKRLIAGETLPFDIVGSASDGVAELFYSVAQVVWGDSMPGFALVHTRLALMLRPDHADAALMAATILEVQGQHDLAIATYAGIPPDNPSFYAAELGRAEAMVVAERSDAAIEVLEGLTRSYPNLPAAWTALGDNLRREDRYEEAAKAYDKAIALSGDVDPGDWSLWYARAIAQERAGQWKDAEKGFRKALELSPDQPAVLNYLGYSYVEKRENLTEALQMIEKAVAGQPDDGYITDSLGWAYYRLGRYDEAAVQMERAVELKPTDALLNDHLGDVYWAVGRKREAEFQWRRALNFGPSVELDLDRVRRKLELGLDEVLKQEGAQPLHPDHAGN